MDLIKQLNLAVNYIEKNLCEEIDFDIVAKTACVSKDIFTRFFSYIAGMSVNEYIRCRKLTLAALDLQAGESKVIDIAVKYGWSSADAFTKAFTRQHGITPTEARDKHASLKIYPPASFYISIKGAKRMDYRIIDLKETKVYGLSKPYDLELYHHQEELRHVMWSDDMDDVPWKICRGRWNEPDSHTMDGLWYGVWHDGKYMIAREEHDIHNDDLGSYTIPAGTYAAFQTEKGAVAWEEFPRLKELIFDSWLPNSEYVLRDNITIEVLHLFTDQSLRKKNRYYEVWIPVNHK